MPNKNYFSFRFLCVAVCLVAGIEACGIFLSRDFSMIAATALLRSAQICCLLVLLAAGPLGLSRAGLSVDRLVPGLKAGAVWSLWFGLVALAAAGILLPAGINPVKLVRVPVPALRPLLFLATAGIIGPVFEELFFRGILYTFFRQFGMVRAVIVVTLLFAGLHLSAGSLPVVPTIGSLVFCISFERSGSLATPMVIHCTGNLALFAIGSC